MSHSPEHKTNFWAKSILDGLLLFGSFIMAHFLKRGDFILEGTDLQFLPIYFFCWLLSSLLGQKFRNSQGQRHLQKLKPYIFSQMLFVAFLSLSLFALKLSALSRFIVFGSIGIHFLVEILLLSDIYIKLFNTGKENVPKREEGFSFMFFMLEILLITVFFIGLYRYRMSSMALSEDYFNMLSLIFFLWIFTGLVIHKFKLSLYKNYMKTIWPYLKSMFIVISLVSFMVFGFKTMANFSRLIVLGSMASLTLFELLYVSLAYMYKKPKRTDEPTVNVFQVPLVEEQKTIDLVTSNGEAVHEKLRFPENDIKSTFIYKKLRTVYLKKYPEIFNFIEENVDLSSIDILKAEVIDTATMYNIEILPEKEMEFFMNLHQLNDFRRLNRYLIEVNSKMQNNCIFISRFQPKERRRILFSKKYPFYLGKILYFFDFVWKRAFPKLPFFQKLYFAFSRGRNRVLSMAESLGRLYYCGFEVLAMKEIDHYVYFVAKKVKEPSTDPKPSYSPIFKMNRVGKNGKMIKVYKFRTMYPYSEYLQDFVVTKFGYAESGKPAHDFRVTAWGKFLRRFWLDELPQLINLFKGEMRILGIRPISQRFLQEFPDNIKKIRSKYKPGCIPAYVPLLKQSKDGFIEAETIYLLEKEKFPVKTDIIFFFKAIYNIASNKIRSE
jgi:hypothetical protein